jgi:hypothetical protein
VTRRFCLSFERSSSRLCRQSRRCARARKC